MLQIYVHTQQPHWEILFGNTRAASGLYKFVLISEIVEVWKYTYDGWELDGTASWEFVEKVINAHKAGKRGCDLGQDLFRKSYVAVWQ